MYIVHENHYINDLKENKIKWRSYTYPFNDVSSFLYTFESQFKKEKVKQRKACKKRMFLKNLSLSIVTFFLKSPLFYILCINILFFRPSFIKCESNDTYIVC